MCKPNDEEGTYTNIYQCPDDHTQWEDTADSMCNDRCPTCDKEIEPMTSKEI